MEDELVKQKIHANIDQRKIFRTGKCRDIAETSLRGIIASLDTIFKLPKQSSFNHCRMEDCFATLSSPYSPKSTARNDGIYLFKKMEKK
jgi:hypothetical protein